MKKRKLNSIHVNLNRDYRFFRPDILGGTNLGLHFQQTAVQG